MEKIYQGNITINKENSKGMEKLLKGYTGISGNLYICSNVKLNANALASVGGDLSIYSNVKLNALTSVGGDLYICSNVKLNANALASVGGDLYICSNVKLNANALASVGGYLSIYSNVKLNANALASVGGDLYICSNVKLNANALTSVGGNLSIHSNVKLNALTSVGGFLYIYSNVKLNANALASVGGDLYICSNVNQLLINRLWEYNNKNKWYINETNYKSFIKKQGNIVYTLKGIELEKEWFLKIIQDKFTAEEVFAIDNIEHRRLAYEYMDKTKMKDLKDYKILDEEIDDKGKEMKIISFNIQNMDEDLIFYNCFCPSTNREYFVQTKYKTCKLAKAQSFGLDNVEWINEF